MAFAPTKPKTNNRGYGNEHVKARKAAARLHRPTDPCARCGQPLGPMGPWLHYDHTNDRAGYLGFSHAKCNRTAGARLARAKQELQRLAIVQTGTGCAHCGKPLTALDRKYCSQRCGWAAHKNDPPKPKRPRTLKVKPKPEPKYCVMCGAQVPKGRTMLCSRDCYVERNARLTRERNRQRQGLPSTYDQPTKPRNLQTSRTW